MEQSGMYHLGFILGMATVLAIAAVVVYFVRRGRNGKCEYDERQELIRGRGFKAAFYTQIGYLVANLLLYGGAGIEWADGVTQNGIGICLSVTVFAAICICQDAYFPLNQKPKRYLLLFAGLTILNFAIGMMNLSDGRRMWTNGMLNFRSMNFVCVGMFVVLFLVLAIRAICSTGSAGEESV
jgi:heme A synthase